MTPILWFGGLSTLVVFVFISLFLFLSWRKKRRQHREFERLLDDVKDRQLGRANKLKRQLGKWLQLQPEDIEALSQQLLTAEKRFLQQFIDQQLQHASNEHFYAQLTELLDVYLNTLSEPIKHSEESSVSEPSKPGNNQDERVVTYASASPAPDWGDVFD